MGFDVNAHRMAASMSGHAAVSKKQRRLANRRKLASHEPLEDRRMLSTIVWDNRLFGDNLAVYGANEVVARQIVDRALGDWEEVIADFNYADGTNTFHVDISVDVQAGPCGSSLTTDVDNLGKPRSANIRMHPTGCGGNSWYFDPVAGTSDLPDDSEFSDFHGPFSASRNNPGGMIDFYTAVLHELGHAMGINGGDPDLRINDYLSGPILDDPVNPSAPGDPGNHLYALNINGGPVEATLTDAGSGDVNNLFAAHLYEGPATNGTNALGLPTHPDDVLNDGRTWNADRGARRLISDFTAELLGMIYDYDITPPSLINTFYANLNLSNGDLFVRGDNGSATDAIEIDEVANDIRAQVNGTSERVWAAAVDFIEVAGGSGNDFIQINATPVGIPTVADGDSGDDVIVIANDGNLALIDGDVTVHGSLGNDILNIQDLGNAANRTYFVSSSSITPSGLGFSINYSPSVQTIFLNGDQGDSTFFVESVNVNGTMNLLGQGGNDNFIMGGSGLFPTLDNIRGQLTIHGGAGQDLARFNDSAHIGSETYTLQDANLGRTDIPHPMAFTNVEELEVMAGQGNDVIDVVRLDDEQTTIDGGAGSDTFVVGDGDIDSHVTADLTILGGAVLGPNDHLIVDDDVDTNNDNYFLTSTTFNKFNFIGSLTYDASINLVTVNANHQDNNIFVDSVAANSLMTINGQGGDDNIFVGNGDIDTNIDGSVVVNGGTGNDDLFLQDQIDQVGNDTYTLTATTFDKTSLSGTIEYTLINSLQLNANQFDNTIDINSTHPDTSLVVNGDDGVDQFNVNAPPSSPITVHGGNPASSPGDALTVTGDAASVGAYEPSGTTTGNGVVTVDGIPITFTGLEPVTVSSFSTFSIRTPNANDDLRIGQFGGNQNVIAGSSNGVAFEELRFFDVHRFIVDMATNDVASGSDVIRLSSGDMPASGVASLVVNAGIGTNSLFASSGVTNLNTSVGPWWGQNLDLTVRGDATVVRFLQSQRIKSLDIISGRVSLEPNGAQTVLETTALEVSGGPGRTATLDVHDNGVIVNYHAGSSPYANLRGQITNGRNENAPVLWTGSGITSAVAANDPLRHAVGYGEATTLFAGAAGMFMGQQINAGDEAVLIRATLLGDANLDAVTDGGDFNIWNMHKFNPGDWMDGDFNYDGSVDGSDFNAWNSNKFQSFDEVAPAREAPVQEGNVGSHQVKPPATASFNGVGLFTLGSSRTAFSVGRQLASVHDRQFVDVVFAEDFDR